MRALLSRLFRKREAAPVIVVSGLPRSGTSMMMKMLQAGGIELLTDEVRAADVDNPEGYYEFERVKELDKGDSGWVPEARGRAVKVISALLEHLPPKETYRVIWMNRRMAEILASQRKMLVHRGEDPTKTGDEKMQDLYAKHVDKVRSWLQTQHNTQVLEMDYNALLTDPQSQAPRIAEFLKIPLDTEAMIAVVNPDLYRNRAR